MISASGAIFAKGTDDDNEGSKELTTILAIDVGERWIGSGFVFSDVVDCLDTKVGFGKART